MQRTRVCRDDEFRAVQQRDQRTQPQRNGNGRGSSCCADEFLRQAFFSRTKADYCAPAVLYGETVMQFAVAFRRPTFRAPAAAGIQHVEISDVVAGEFVRDLFLIFRAQGQRKSRRGSARARCFGEGEIVVDFMCAARIDFIGVKHGCETFASVGACETDAAGRAGREDWERGFVQTLKVYGAGVVRGTQLSYRGDKPAGVFLFERDYFGEIRVAFEQATPLWFDEPVDPGLGKGIA